MHVVFRGASDMHSVFIVHRDLFSPPVCCFCLFFSFFNTIVESNIIVVFVFVVLQVVKCAVLVNICMSVPVPTCLLYIVYPLAFICTPITHPSSFLSLLSPHCWIKQCSHVFLCCCRYSNVRFWPYFWLRFIIFLFWHVCVPYCNHLRPYISSPNHSCPLSLLPNSCMTSREFSWSHTRGKCISSPIYTFPCLVRQLKHLNTPLRTLRTPQHSFPTINSSIFIIWKICTNWWFLKKNNSNKNGFFYILCLMLVSWHLGGHHGGIYGPGTKGLFKKYWN